MGIGYIISLSLHISPYWGGYLNLLFRLLAEQKSVLLGREYTNIKYAAEFGNTGSPFSLSLTRIGVFLDGRTRIRFFI